MYSIRMYRILSVLLVFFFAFSVSAQVETEKDDFVSGFEDLPLMSGLIQLEDGAVSFDSPSGRIVEAYAESPTLTADKISKFYADTLPQLGWKKNKNEKQKNGLAFTRDGESLEISFEKSSHIVVRFELTTQQ